MMQHWWILLIAGVLTGTFYLLYQRIKFGPRGEGTLALAMKGAATLCCTGMAVWGAFFLPGPGKGMLAAGLVVCAAADVLLAKRFLPGMGCFALGHVCYGIAFCQAHAPGMANLMVCLTLNAGVQGLLPFLRKLSGEKSVLPFFGYGLILSVMVSLAVGQTPLLTAGAVLFALSDGMLGYRMMRNIQGKAYDYACLGCYYLAQFFIGASVICG